jgi:malate synthase
MTQQQLQRPVSLCGKLINALFGASIGDEERMVSVLDEAIPLQGASHADVVEYSVEIPMRYAECFALLSDGRKVALRNPRQFVGWSTHDRNRSLLFRSNGKHYEVAVEEGLRGQSPGCIRTVFLEAKSERRSSLARKFIGIDGDLVILPVLPATI